MPSAIYDAWTHNCNIYNWAKSEISAGMLLSKVLGATCEIDPCLMVAILSGGKSTPKRCLGTRVKVEYSPRVTPKLLVMPTKRRHLLIEFSLARVLLLGHCRQTWTESGSSLEINTLRSFHFAFLTGTNSFRPAKCYLDKMGNCAWHREARQCSNHGRSTPHSCRGQIMTSTLGHLY